MQRLLYILMLAGISISTFCTPKKERIKPRLSPVTESVYASATVKAEGQYEVFSKVTAILKSIKVKPGQALKRGSNLFVLDNRQALLNIESSRLALELSRQNYQKNSEKIRQMEIQVRLNREHFLLDSSIYIRQKHLWNQGVGSQLDLEQKRLAYISSKDSYQSSQLQLRDLKAQLKNELQRNQVNYNINRELGAEYLIQSAFAGIVYTILVDEGQLVTPQAPLAIIGKDGRFLLELEVDENDISKLELGQAVEITMDSFRGQVFQGRVSKIYPLMDQASRTFKVEALFLNPPAHLYPNLSAETNIIIRKKEKALIIPRNYLIDNHYVLLKGNKKHRVETGLADYQKVEVISGLDTSQYIYKPE